LERGKKKKKKPKPCLRQIHATKKNGPIKSHKKAQIKLGTLFTKGVGKIHLMKKQMTHWRR
jgi:hypothetical protein